MIGFFRNTAPSDSPDVITAYRAGLAESGYVEGRNVGDGVPLGPRTVDLVAAPSTELLTGKDTLASVTVPCL